MSEATATERQIEAILDAVGWDAFLSALETVCYAKAQHIEENWQDTVTARPWKKAGREIDKLIGKAIL